MVIRSDRNDWFHRRARFLAPVVGVLVLTAAAYVITLRFGFVYDDHLQIEASPAVHSWRLLPHYFTTHVWQYSQPSVAPAYYRPIFLLWILMSYTLFGLNPVWWHLITIGVHLVSTLMLYLLARRLTGDRTIAAFASLIFGLNPVHVEAVAWVSGVTEPLLAVFIVSSLLCYLNFRDQKRPLGGWFALSLVLYIFALLEKETAVVFPAIVFGYEAIFWAPLAPEAGERRGRVRLALMRAAPYLVLALGYLAARTAALGGLRIAATPLAPLTMVLTLPSVLFFYFKRLIWPFGLSPFYDLPYVTRVGFFDFIVPTMIVALGALGLGLWSMRSRRAAFASLWILLPLLPVLNLRALGPEELVHDRYLYLPSIGFSLLSALALRKFKVSCPEICGRRGLQVLSVTVLAGLLAAGTVAQSRYWEDDIDLFRRGVAVAPDNSLPKHALAIQLGSLGMYSEAIPLLREVLERRPYSFEANVALGRYYYCVGAFVEAELHLSRALNIRPRLTRVPYAYLGQTRMELGQMDRAEATIREGLRIEPLDSDNRFIHGALGEVLERKGDLRAALAEFRSELASNTRSHEARAEVARIEARLQATAGKSSPSPAQ